MNDVLIPGKYSTTFHVPNVIETIGFELLINGIYEEETIEFICRKLNSNCSFLDIGANIGAIAIPVAKQRKDVRVICVEASPWVFKYLEKNILANPPIKVALINKAIAESLGIFIQFYCPKDQFGKGSMAPVFTLESTRVETITLDKLLLDFPDVGMIKIDVEGFEYQAFQGGAKTLCRLDSPDILFEFVDWAERAALNTEPGKAQEILLEYGYNLYVFHEGLINKKIDKPLREGASMLLATKKTDLVVRSTSSHDYNI